MMTHSIGQKFRRRTAQIFLILLLSESAYGATEAQFTYLGERAAAYLTAIVIAQEMATGKCKRELVNHASLPTDLRAAKREVLLAFPRKYAPDLVKFYVHLDGPMRLDAKELANDPRVKSADDCRAANHFLAGMVENAVADWLAAKAQYGVR